MFIPTGFLVLLLVEEYALCVTGVCSTESCYSMLVRCLFDVFVRLADCLSVLGKCSYLLFANERQNQGKKGETYLLGLLWWSCLLFFILSCFGGFIVLFVEIWLIWISCCHAIGNMMKTTTHTHCIHIGNLLIRSVVCRELLTDTDL